VEINFEDEIKVLILMSSLLEFWDIVINEIQSNAIRKKNCQRKIFETNKYFVLCDISNHSFEIP